MDAAPAHPSEAAAHAALLIAGMEVTVACPAPGRGLARAVRAAPPVGFLARRGAFVHALYLAPRARRRGIGSALLAAAKATSERLTLWVFAANLPARAFYATHGFQAVEAGDGSGNDEGLPELRLEWRREEQQATGGAAEAAPGRANPLFGRCPAPFDPIPAAHPACLPGAKPAAPDRPPPHEPLERPSTPLAASRPAHGRLRLFHPRQR